MYVQAIPRKDGGKPTAMKLGDQTVDQTDFPDLNTKRWVVGRKMVLVGAVVSGIKTTDDILAMYPSVSRSELETWVTIFREKGHLGLRQTRIQDLPRSEAEVKLILDLPEEGVERAGLTLVPQKFLRDLDGKVATFTSQELRVLSVLMLNPGTTITKYDLLKVLYPKGDEAELKIIDVFVCKIRMKIRGVFNKELIETVWGRGYLIR